MERDKEIQPGSLNSTTRLEAGSGDTEESEKKLNLCPQTEDNLASGSYNQNKEHSLGNEQYNRRDQEHNGKNSGDSEQLVDRLVSMAVEGGNGSEGDEEEGDFLSASEGESDDEKIQEWGDTLSEPADSFQLKSEFITAAADKCDPVYESTSEVNGQGSAGEQGSTAAEMAADDVEEVGGGGDAEETDTDEKEEAEEKDKEMERKRQEAEDALTEEERQSRLAEAVKVKTSGNDAFKQSQYKEAIDLYTKGLEMCPLKYVQQRSIMLSNRAACHMKEEYYEKAVKDCCKAIDLQPTYIKAINRRADAYEKLEKLEEALKDHQKILELDRTQASSYHACMRLENEIKERNEKLKEEMIGKLKDLGNLVLRPFGLSTNNFQLNQDPNSGGYSVQFVQSPPDNGH